MRARKKEKESEMSEKEKSRDYRRAFDGRPGSGNPSVPLG